MQISSSSMKGPHLEVIRGNLTRKVIPLTSGNFMIGRSSLNNLQLRDDPAISRRHAVLRYEDGMWFIQDQGSSGGTYVNNQPVQASRLKPGDQIAIGSYLFAFQAAELVPVAPQPGLAGGHEVQPVYPVPFKSRGMALVLEIFPGLLGFLGIGWIYAGRTSAGVITLIIYLIWNVVASIIDAATVGIFLCVHGPINILCLILSPIFLNNYARQHPEKFGE